MEQLIKTVKKFDTTRGFSQDKLSEAWHSRLLKEARDCRGNILKMTTLAMSGHPGGSSSSIEMYLLLYHFAKVDPLAPNRDDRDRIIISHGHTSPGVYTALASAGFFNVDDAVAGFRLAGSPFEGHVERSVPGVEWGTGNLGQGLSVGLGKALYARLSHQTFHTYVVMGDGEQQKGQISESRRIASKFKLNKLTVLIDYNRLQISGSINVVMPQNIIDEWRSDGWNVLEVDGHDLNQLYAALREATHEGDKPTMVLARTVMGKGVSFMENDHNYHGAPVKPEMLAQAFEELGVENNFEALKAKRAGGISYHGQRVPNNFPKVASGDPLVYGADVKTDCRSAFGSALESVAAANQNKGIPFGVFDCDLAGSVKTAGFEKKYPEWFFQFGISEHSTATTVGSLSAEKAVAVWADFGAFGVAETYNQARLNDINHAHVKLFCTHCGINVGEDGMTHQCIDYFGLLNSTFGWKVITPADPNQCDRIVRYVLTQPGNFAVIMGRAKLPIILDEQGQPYFGSKYTYRYGRMEKIRNGEKVAIVSSGNMTWSAMSAYELLKKEQVKAALYSVSDWSDLHADDIKALAAYDGVVTYEDHNVKTGLGTALADALMAAGYMKKMHYAGSKHYRRENTDSQSPAA